MPRRAPTIEEIEEIKARIVKRRDRHESTTGVRARLYGMVHDRLRHEVRAMKRRAK